MRTPKQILMLGLDPSCVDFNDFPDLTADKVLAGLQREQAKLRALGHDAHLCLVGLGAAAEVALLKEMTERKLDCVVIGAGLRTAPAHFLLFERLLNIVHKNAPEAAICFNTHPGDTAEAVRRWISPDS